MKRLKKITVEVATEITAETTIDPAMFAAVFNHAIEMFDIANPPEQTDEKIDDQEYKNWGSFGIIH